MFKVFVLLWSVSNSQECVTFNDRHGLKATKEQCKILAIEMTRDLEKVITNPFEASYVDEEEQIIT